MKTYEWDLPAPVSYEALSEFADLPAAIARALIGRGFERHASAQQFLDAAGLPLRDPFALKDMDAAVARLRRAIDGREPLVVYGDYDADGVTASALMVSALRQLGGVAEHYIPNRFAEGYGLNSGAIDNLHARGTALIVTVDCGIRSVSEVSQARRLGMDVILTDHHHPGPELPPANAIINPDQPDDDYPFGGLSGVGLAYKLVGALSRSTAGSLAESYLDLVALGTVADVSPLIDENRTLVALGLDQLRRQPRPGLDALVQSAGLTKSSLMATNIAFGLAPRINAAGRQDSAELAYDLLMAADHQTAVGLAAQLEAANRKRQDRTRKVYEMARTCGPWTPDDGRLIFAVHPEFSEGVVGLAASRLAEEFLKPAFVARREGEFVKGSARSVPGFHITEALEACSDLLVRFGGHAAAAGFTLRAADLESLLERLTGLADEAELSVTETPRLSIDAEISAAELNLALLEVLDKFEPTGEANPRPVFVLRGARVVNRRAVGSTGAHLKVSLMRDGRPMDGIAFRQGDRASYLPQVVDVAFTFERNEFRGVASPQLNILDFHPSEGG